jgi:hypothetical protein
MKLLFLACIMALTMNAQTFNGVSIGGTVEAPTLVNQSGKAVMAYVVQRFDTNNVNTVTTVPHVYDLIRGLPVQGPLGMIFGMRRGIVDHNTGKMVEEGDVIRWELKAVVFADGTHYGTNFTQLSQMFSNFRSFARSLQDRGPTTWRATFNGMNRTIPRNDQEGIVYALSGLPESEWEEAITRVASLPDIVKGK